MTEERENYRWSDPDVVAILSRDYLEEDLDVIGEMTDEFFQEVKKEIQEDMCMFLQDCYYKVLKRVPNGITENTTND